MRGEFNLPTIAEPKSFSELLEVIEEFQSTSDASWYRGCRNAGHCLQPSIMRHAPVKPFKEIHELEKQIASRFVQRSLPFVSRPFMDEWDKLFFMQHYGVPTRLLDWTENPFVAIYFAMTPLRVEPDKDAALWLCDPVKWNSHVMSSYSGKKGILDQSSRFLTQYSPEALVDDVPNHPIMMYGTYNSPRIVAQRGGFALFGNLPDPMEQIHQTGGFAPECLQKVTVKKEHIPDIRSSLLKKGFTESVVFPDLDGLAKEIRREFGFEQ
ncbi:MAG: FRG domain-containing protein [Alphaproteobacteria bacterium]|nr:MAG: FRG domain-containing protein [Alphaproteobacteria bacterium]